MSPPLFTWDTKAPEQGVSFDELHQRLVHRHKDGFSTADLLDEGNTPDGLFVRCDLPDLNSARFSPDGLHFAFLRGMKTMGVMETLCPTREPITFQFKWTKQDLQVLDFFWLPPGPQQVEGTADIAVISTQGLEVFRLSFEHRIAKSQKAFQANVRLCWAEPITGMVLVCIGSRTLQPFDLRAKSTKMAKFDLVLDGDSLLKVHDVSVSPIYDSTYCIHADGVNSRVSLRNISDSAQGTPEQDIVIDVAWDEKPVGALRLSTVDNLLIVHCLDREASLVFDIRHRDGALVPCICGPCALAKCAPGCGQSSWSSWAFLPGNTIVVPEAGAVFRLRVDIGQVLQDFRARQPNDLVAVMRLLLGRASCREHAVRALRGALHSKPSLNEWAQAFLVLNQAYRRSIETVSQRNATAQGRQTTVSLQELEALISHQSVLSENHMVSQVFHPYFLEITASSSSSSAPSAASSAGAGAGGTTSPLAPGAPAAKDRWRIPLPPSGAGAGVEGSGASSGACGSRPPRSPYILSVVVAYLRSLLGMQILPHKILQCFVFDTCMYFQQEHTLQQLLHYHVLLDSPELVARLQEVVVTRSSPWATQACLDMAMRAKEHRVVAEVLLHSRQYLDLVPFLINQRDVGFKFRRLLERLENDEQAREEDPELLSHVISELRAWREEAALPPLPGLEGEQVSPPDLEGCEAWMPDLARAASAAVPRTVGAAVG